MHARSLTASLLLLLSTSALPAQRTTGGPDPDRKALTHFVVGDDGQVLAGVFLGYTPADWRDGYDAMLDEMKGSNYSRLGKGWWTTLETVGPVEIGGKRLEPGSYYLGIAVDKEGAFSLLVFDSRQALQAGLLPATTALYRGDARPQIRVPMSFARDVRKDVVGKLTLEITADQHDPKAGRLVMRWGRHELSAPLVFRLAQPKDSPATGK